MPKVAAAAAYEAVHVDINDEIILCRSAQGVLAVCERRLAEFNAVNVATAVHRIAKSADGADPFEHPVGFRGPELEGPRRS